jgi:BCD family chlorophyll transporter-like MFS transporter
MATGGIVRDLVAHRANAMGGYLSVYTIEIALLLLTLLVMTPLLRPPAADA